MAYGKKRNYRKRKRSIKKGQRGYVRRVGNYGRYNAAMTTSPEMKYFDTNLAYTNITTTGVVTSPTFNLINLGTGENNRIGRQVTVRRIMIRGSINLRAQEDPAQSANKFRIVVFQDKQANGAAATWLNIMQTADIDSFRNLENSRRFKILHDKFHTLNPGGGGQNTPGTKTWAEVYRHFAVYIKCAIKLEYGTTNPPTIADMRSNNLGIMVIAEEPQTDNIPRIQYSTRLRYTDS